MTLGLGDRAWLRSGSTVLCLGAHADDIEIGCGGTLVRLLEEHPDVSVHWVVLSAPGARRDEALKSANVFLTGAASAEVSVQGHEERYFPYDGGALKRSFDELGASISPDLVFTHRREDLHQDHRLVSELTWNTFRHQLILEYEIPKWDGDLGQPNLFVPLAEDVCERKVSTILREFGSQRERDWFTADTFWATLRLRGVECHAPSGFAEAFHARKLILP
ncbi:MAG TPA: PIG-L deacetylase family protein [Actinomycetota bacterium]|jgi:LmbE family N-acetylglucosaminyl deacetylase